MKGRFDTGGCGRTATKLLFLLWNRRFQFTSGAACSYLSTHRGWEDFIHIQFSNPASRSAPMPAAFSMAALAQRNGPDARETARPLWVCATRGKWHAGPNRPSGVRSYRFLAFHVQQGRWMVEKRTTPRRRVLRAGTIEFGRSAIDCTIHNLSTKGAALDVASPMGIPEKFTLVLISDGLHFPCRVICRKERRIGVVLINSITLEPLVSRPPGHRLPEHFRE
jgi:hypothetical protein